MKDVQPARNADVHLVVVTGEEDGLWLDTSNAYKSLNVACQVKIILELTIVSLLEHPGRNEVDGVVDFLKHGERGTTSRQLFSAPATLHGQIQFEICSENESKVELKE